MCEPTLAVMAIMAVASMASQVMANKAQNKAMEVEAQNANMAASYDMQRLADQRGEMDEQAAQDKWQRQLQTQREHGKLMVAIGESGVGGNSALRTLNNAMMQGSYDMSVIEANRLSNARQNTANMDSVHATNQGRLNMAEAQSVDSTTGMLNTGLAGISGAAQGHQMGKSWFDGKPMTTGAKETTLQTYKRTGIH